MKHIIYFASILLVLFQQQQFVCGQLQCGTVGRVGSSRTGSSMRNIAQNEFYINRGNRAECAGMITSISYCFHRPPSNVSLADEYLATVAVYTPASGSSSEVNFNQSINSTFTIQKSVENLLAELNASSDPNFACSEHSLPEPVSVAVGDVLGACLFDPPDASSGQTRYRLDLVSRAQTQSEDLLRTDTHPNNSAKCSATSAPNSLDGLRLGTSRSRSLHLWANIVSVELSPTTNQRADGPTTARPMNNISDPSTIATIALAAVVAIFVILLLSILLARAVVALNKKKHGRSRQLRTDSLEYELDTVGNFERQSDRERVNRARPDERGVWPTQSQEHVYEFERSTNFTQSLEATYAEISSMEIINANETFYESLLTTTSVSYCTLLDKNREEDIYGGVSPYEVPASIEDDIYQQLDAWRTQALYIEQLEITRHLGSGQFGSVEQGVWKRQGTKPVDVALKSLTKTSEEDRVKFLQEAAIMAQFRHPNVIMLYGYVTSREPMMLVVELAEKGDLRQFLLSQKPDPGQEMPSNASVSLLSFSQQVALGMQYLSAKGFVHRDLAARNVLVTKDNVCKVADFGMSRDLEDQSYYLSHGGKIPVKWTAPEAIHYKKYSTASDVWAYGCLLYEIWSVGHKPFEGVTNPEAMRTVEANKRLSPPPGCPKRIYELMIICWHPETSERPCFRDILLMLVDNEEMVLFIPEEDSSSHPLAGVLGATLEAGENMYTQLQKRYIDYVHKAGADADTDYFDVL